MSIETKNCGCFFFMIMHYSFDLYNYHYIDNQYKSKKTISLAQSNFLNYFFIIIIAGQTVVVQALKPSIHPSTSSSTFISLWKRFFNTLQFETSLLCPPVHPSVLNFYYRFFNANFKMRFPNRFVVSHYCRNICFNLVKAKLLSTFRTAMRTIRNAKVSLTCTQTEGAVLLLVKLFFDLSTS